MRAPLACLLAVTALACGDPAKPAQQATPAPSNPSPAPASPTATPAVAAKPTAATGERIEIANVRGACARTLCVAGPGEPSSPANLDLDELCRRAPGVVRRCEGERCLSAWTPETWRAGLDALITSLDADADGAIDANDPACTINLAGWSTCGAIVATELPAALAADPRLAADPSRTKVAHLVAIAPWAPALDRLSVADNVGKAWIYRHTISPEHDCSSAWEGGPWRSPAPACGPTTQCWDYDYSLEPLLAYIGRRGARSGSEVGHCDIVPLVAKIGLDNLARGVEAYAELVPHYSDGSHGGRKRPEGPPPPWAKDSAPPE